MSKEPDESWKRAARRLSHQQQVDERTPAGTEHALKPFVKAEVNGAQVSLVINAAGPLPEKRNQVCDGSNRRRRSPRASVLPQDVTRRLWRPRSSAQGPRLRFHTVPALSRLFPAASPLRSPPHASNPCGDRERCRGGKRARHGGAGLLASAGAPDPGERGRAAGRGR